MVGKYTLNAMELNFGDKMKTKELQYFDVLTDDPANERLIKKFEVNEGGLYILTVNNGQELIENLTEFAFLTIGDETEVFMNGVKASIEDKFKKPV
jgi:hypothetical protein